MTGFPKGAIDGLRTAGTYLRDKGLVYCDEIADQIEEIIVWFDRRHPTQLAQDTELASPSAGSPELKACPFCKAKCSVQTFAGEHIIGEMHVWICSNHQWLGGDCPHETAYLSEEAWNTRTPSAASTPEADDVLADAIEACDDLEAFPSNYGEVDGRITEKGSRYIDQRVSIIRAALTAKPSTPEADARHPLPPEIACDQGVIEAVAIVLSTGCWADLYQSERNEYREAARKLLGVPETTS